MCHTKQIQHGKKRKFQEHCSVRPQQQLRASTLALSISGGRGCKALGGSSSLTGHPQNPKRTHKPRTLSTHPSRSQKNGTTDTEPCTKERKPWHKQAARTALPRPSRARSSVEALASHASAAPHTARCAPTSRTMKTLIVNLCSQDDSTRGSVQNLLRNPPPFQPATLAPRFWGAPPPCYPVLPSSSIGEFNTHRPVRGRRRLGWCLTWSPDIFEHFIAWGDNDDIAQKVHTCASPPSPPSPLWSLDMVIPPVSEFRSTPLLWNGWAWGFRWLEAAAGTGRDTIRGT